ncbi:MAG TPA: RNA degradosome polyphosphate kinase [Firmicutes bacterium]|nr:RNA degradosome polyphosphate kinase [Bacillota bacterium]
MEKDFSAYENYINREMSWLQFNRRVLEEAQDEQNPLLERVNFLAIVSSNLDEFFMVRIGSLYSKIDMGLTKKDFSGLRPNEQIKLCLKSASKILNEQYECYEGLTKELNEIGIQILDYEDLLVVEKQALDDYFDSNISPVLTPMVIDPARPFPLIQNKSLNIGLMLKEKQSLPAHVEPIFATVQVPSVLNRLVQVPNGEDNKFILLESLIQAKCQELFSSHHILGSSCYRITRNADILLDEEGTEDLLETIEQSLKQRRFGECVRLELEKGANDFIVDVLKEEYEIAEEEIYEMQGPIDLTFLSKIMNLKHFDDYRFEPNRSQSVVDFEQEHIFELLKKKDIFLHHPYHSFSTVTKFIETAAKDPNVLAIKQTLYRVSGNSPIIHALTRAAESGKQVTVLVELKARFDEENNIHWARQLEKAGCHVIYGIIGLKTHAKITLVVRREESGIRRYVHLGTGNYNDVTARFYTDMGVLTSNSKFGADASALFNMLSGYADSTGMSKITIAPIDMRSKFIDLIRREAEIARVGKEAKIIAKMNSLADRDIIMELYKASCAGVKIELIVRGICMLKPGVHDLSENITVRSIVGRYLEHSRIFYFYQDGKEEVYLASADWMSRNLSKRVETMGIIDDVQIKQTIKEILELYLKDNVKARLLKADGTYEKIQNNESKLNVQEYLFEYTKEKETHPHSEKRFFPGQARGSRGILGYLTEFMKY